MKQWLFLLLLLLSGFAGISYEILYGRMLGNLIGDQFAVSAAVLITFLLGIGIGSRHAWRLWRWLWLIELLIGLCGAAFAFGGGALEWLLYAGLPLLPSGLSGSIIAAVLLLLLPAFLIGCSVPLFAGYLERISGGTEFARVYAIYNIAAALTAVLIEYLLLRSFGIVVTVLCFVVLNIVIALLLRAGFAGSAAASPPPVTDAQDGRTRRDWLALAPVSMASAVFQLLMVKLAEMLLGPFRESFALVLSIVLLGIALGSLLVRRYRTSFATLLLLAIGAAVLLLLSLQPVAYLYATLYERAAASYAAAVLLKWGCLLLLMGPAALAFGATIPALLHSRSGEGQSEVSRASGRLLFIASMANVAGFLLMVFVLHRYLDYGVIVLVIGLLTACSLLFAGGGIRRGALAALLLLAGGAAFLGSWDEELLYVSYTSFRDVDELDAARDASIATQRYKGYQDVFAINRVDGEPYFFINGYNSIPLNNPSERIAGALSSMFAPRVGQALVLGLGSGATASVVGQLFDRTDVVEINPVVRRNLFRMKQWNFDIESNPRVHITVDDAIHYARVAPRRYDLVLNTVTTPLYFSSSKLYTTDFLGVVKERLHPDGIYVTWMDARIGDRGVDIILETIRQRFRHCALLYIKSSYFLLICSDQPLRAHQPQRLRAGLPAYDSLLNQAGIVPEWLKYQLLVDDVLELSPPGREAAINSADYPALEFEMARLSGRGIAAFKRRLRKAMDLERVRAALAPVGADYPADLVWHTVLRLKDSLFTRRWKQLALRYRADFERVYADAETRYRARLLAAGGSADAWHELGYRLMREHRYAQALEAFGQALARDAAHNNTHFNIAVCYERLGRYANALAHYLREAAVDPGDEDVSCRIGRVYVEMGRFADALAPLRQASAAGDNWRAYDYLARAYRGLGRDEQAQAASRQAEALRR